MLITNSDSLAFQTVLDVLSDHSRRNPDAEFLSSTANIFLSYRDVHHLSTRLIPNKLLSLCSALSQPNGRVALISSNTPLVPLTFWSLWSLSATAVHLSASSDPKLWLSMLELTSIDLVLVSESLLPKLAPQLERQHSQITIATFESLIPHPPQLSIKSIQSSIIACRDWLRSTRDSLLDYPTFQPPTPTTPASILFTSSAVNAATLKCVTYTHAALLAASWKSVEGLGGPEYISLPKRHLGWLPLSHCYELNFSYLGIVLRSGGAYIFHDPLVSSPNIPSNTPLSQQLLSSLEYHQPVDSFCVVPTILASAYQHVTSSQLQCLQSLASLCAGGAPSPGHLSSWALGHGIKYADMIGATELVGLACTRKFWRGESGFELVPGLYGVIEKENEGDTFGELIVLGKNLPRSYEFPQSDSFHYDAENDITTYRTQDLYSQGPNFAGHTIVCGQTLPNFEDIPHMSGIQYIGRLDDMVILSSGIKLDAIGLERTLDAQAEILRSAIVTTAKQDGIVALIEPSPRVSLEAIVRTIMHLNSSFPYEHRIQRDNIIIVDSLPLTSKLTLHRKQLKVLLGENGGTWPTSRRRNLTQLPLPQSPSPVQISNQPKVYVPPGLRETMEGIIAEIFSIDIADVRDPAFTAAEVPMTSLSSVRLAGMIRDRLHVQITQAQLYNARSITELCQLISESSADPPSLELETVKISPPPVEIRDTDRNLVIAGAACLYPGGISSLEDLWSVLLSPEPHASTIARPAPISRWDAEAEEATLPIAWLDDSVINDVSSFASFFRLSLGEAGAMPPNVRLAMKVGYAALEDAGVAPSSLAGKPWGVFTSVNDSGWRERQVQKLGVPEYARFMTSLIDDGAGSRLAYHLDLAGPSVEIKTACSSSSVAIHQACLAIQNGDCEAAIIIASTAYFAPAGTIFRQRSGIGSPSGRCATFSTKADGFLPSEGAVAIVIRREKDVTTPAYARIRGTAIGQDGRGLNFLAPNSIAQAKVLEAALRKARCVPDDISYFEAHGTGTPVGDSIEIAAINRVYGGKRSRALVVGAAKAVVGHTEECAGLTGVLKAIQCFKYNIIPPQPNLENVNPELDVFPSKIIFPRSALAFSRHEGPRLIGISSFGLSGTLSHMVLEEPHVEPPTIETDQPGLFLLSGTSQEAINVSIKLFLRYSCSVSCKQTPLIDVCRTTQLGRDHFPYRRAWAVKSWRDLVKGLSLALDEVPPTRTVRNPTISLWFPLPHQGREFPMEDFVQHPVYKDTIDRCFQVGCSPRLEPFAKQLAMANVLEALGCKISGVGGEGVGEYVAACFAGVFDLATLFSALSNLSIDSDVVSHIARCSQSILEESLLAFGPGEMQIIGDYGNEASCLRGSPEAFERLQGELGPGIFTEASPFTRTTILSTWEPNPQPPRIPVVSSYLGEIMEASLVESSNYWTSVPGRFMHIKDARNSLSVNSQLLLDLGSIGGTPESSSMVGTLVDTLFGRLFEAGCAIDWPCWTKPGPMAHFPGHPFTSNDDLHVRS